MRNRGAAAVLLVCLFILGGSCRSTDAVPEVIQPGVGGLDATLEDETRDLPDLRVAWSTYWKLCWDPYEGALEYEVQAITGEGASPRLRRQSDRCFRIQAAAGENERADGPVNRDMQFALQSGQLAYRVRARLDGNRVTDWSPTVAVGKRLDLSPAP